MGLGTATPHDSPAGGGAGEEAGGAYSDSLRVELYNLREDIRESNDLSKRLPDKVKELRDRLHAWRKEVGAQMPAPNPRYDATKPEYTPNRKAKETASRAGIKSDV